MKQDRNHYHTILLSKIHSLTNFLVFQGAKHVNINESFAKKCDIEFLARSKYFEKLLARSKNIAKHFGEVNRFLARSEVN